MSWLKRLLAGLSPRRTEFDSKPVHVRCGGQSDAGKDFLRVIRFSPCQYHTTNTPNSSSSACYSYDKDKRASPGNLPKCNALSEVGSIGQKKHLLSVSKRLNYFHKKNSKNKSRKRHNAVDETRRWHRNVSRTFAVKPKPA